MGSTERIEYAVIADSVNCASRLESLTKAAIAASCGCCYPPKPFICFNRSTGNNFMWNIGATSPSKDVMSPSVCVN